MELTVVDLFLETMTILEMRHGPYPIAEFLGLIQPPERIASACRVTSSDGKPGVMILMTFGIEPNIRRIMLGALPMAKGKSDAEGKPVVEWGVRSDMRRDLRLTVLLEASRDDGLIQPGMMLRSTLVQHMIGKLPAMIARRHQAVPAAPGSGTASLFIFEPASYVVESPVILADAIEEVLSVASFC